MSAWCTGSFIRRFIGHTGPTLAPECGAPASARKSRLLLLPIVDFLPPDDAHIKATVLGIADELKQAGLVLLYRVEGTDMVSLFCMPM